jgi:hypothetical protein
MSEELVTMREIAAFAQVRRPVVTVWRRRHRASSRPFPSPHQQRGGQELFSREEVVAWLEETERGNNPDARAEAATTALLSDPRLEAPRSLDALSALLVVRGLTGEPLTGMDRDEVLDVADAFDPDDTFLIHELEQADDLLSLVQATEQLVSASWSVSDAHERLLSARLPAVIERTILSSDAIRTMVALASPLLRELGPDTGLLDPSGCRFDLMAELATATDASLALLDGTTRSHRLNRRILRLAKVVPTLISAEGGWSAHGPTLSVLVLPQPARPFDDPVALLAVIDDVAVQLTDEQALLVLAPAALLTDPLKGTAASQRDQLLRAGYVRAVVRLPAGMMPARARESMALWLVASADPTPPADRRTLVADISRRPLDAPTIDGLASDLLAALLGVESVRRRAWAHLHPVTTTSLLVGSGSLVPPRSVSPSESSSPASLNGADWVIRLSADAANYLPGHGLAVANQPSDRVSLLHAEGQGWVRVIPGRRFDIASLNGALEAPVRCWDAAAVADPQTQRVVDRLALHRHLDPILTEPGDVVFVNRPQPVARFDADGGAAVFSPVRILRVRADAPLVPSVLAMRLNAETSTDWRSWTLPAIPQPQPLAAAHAELATHRAHLLAELADLDQFTTDLTTAVESGQLNLTMKENHGQASG